MASAGEISVAFRAFTGGFTSGINQVVAGLDKSAAAMQTASAAGGLKAFNDLSRATGESIRHMGAIANSSLAAMTGHDFAAVSAGIRSTVTSLSSMTAGSRAAALASASMSTSLDSIRGIATATWMHPATQSLRSFGDATITAIGSNKSLQIAGRMAGASMRMIASSAGLAGGKLLGVTASLMRYIDISGRVTAVSKAITGVMKQLAVIALPITFVASIAKGISAGIGFERQMSNLQSKIGATGETLKSLEQEALRLGSSTQFSASQSAEAMTEFAKAGFDANQILGATDSTLKLAAAGELELAEAATIVGRNLKTFGLAASEAQRVADVLAAGATSAATDVSNLGRNLGFAAPMAVQAGQSLESTVSALAVLSDRIGDERAGTTFRQILAKMAKPSQEATKKMEQLGLTFRDVTGNFLPLNQVVDQFREKMASLSTGDATNALATIFDVEAASGFGALMTAGGDAVARMDEKMLAATGTVNTMADVMTNNTQGALTRLTSAMEGLSIQMAKPMLKPMMESLDAIATSLGQVTPLISKLTEGFQAVDISADSIESKIQSFARFTGFLGNVARAVQMVGISIREVASWVGAVTVGIGGYVVQFAEGIVNAFGSLIAEIGHSINALAKMAAKVEGVVPGAGSVADALRSAAEATHGFGSSMQGVDFGSKSMMNLATALAAQVNEDKKKFQELLDAPLLSTQIESGIEKLNQMKTAADKTGNAVAEVAASSFDPFAAAGKAFEESLGITPSIDSAGFFDKFDDLLPAIAQKPVDLPVDPKLSGNDLAEAADRLNIPEIEKDVSFKLTEAVDATTSGIFGTFARSSLFRGGTADKQLKATEDVAKSTQNSEKLLDEIKTIMSKQPTIVEAPIG